MKEIDKKIEGQTPKAMREIDCKIASIKGWEIVEREKSFLRRNEIKLCIKRRGKGQLPILPNYSTSIPDAWKLWEELPRPVSIVVTEKYGYEIAINDTGVDKFGVPLSGNNYIACEEKTFPLAVCKAWIAWKGSHANQNGEEV